MTYFGPESGGMTLKEIQMLSTGRLAVTLEARQGDAVLQIMAKSPVPYEFVAPLLHGIQSQCTRRQAEDKPGAT